MTKEQYQQAANRLRMSEHERARLVKLALDGEKNARFVLHAHAKRAGIVERARFRPCPNGADSGALPKMEGLEMSNFVQMAKARVIRKRMEDDEVFVPGMFEQRLEGVIRGTSDEKEAHRVLLIGYRAIGHSNPEHAARS